MIEVNVNGVRVRFIGDMTVGLNAVIVRDD